MYQDKTVGAVIPAYNEEGHIGTVIDTLPDYIDRAYVIDDGSTDGTWAEIQAHAERVNDHQDRGDTDSDSVDTVVEPIQHEDNRGVGGAIKTGYRRALIEGIDVVTVISGDEQTEPDIVERIVEPVANGTADYAKGNRMLLKDRSDMPRFRQIGNFMLSFLTKVASGYWKVMDPQNGSTAISHTALQQLDLDELYEDYGFENDILVRLNVHGLRVADVSRRAVYKNETSHISYRSFVPNVSMLLLRDFLWRLRAKYLVKDFHPLVFLYYAGAVGVATGILTLLWSLLGDGDVKGSTAMVLCIVGLLCLVEAMIFDMEENRDLQVLLYDVQEE